MMSKDDRPARGDVINVVTPHVARDGSLWVQTEDSTREPAAVREIRDDETSETQQGYQYGIHGAASYRGTRPTSFYGNGNRRASAMGADRVASYNRGFPMI